MMTKFESRANFGGTYEGFHDGRRALLNIMQMSADRMVFFISLVDLDEKNTFMKAFYIQDDVASGNEHNFTDERMGEYKSRTEGKGDESLYNKVNALSVSFV